MEHGKLPKLNELIRVPVGSARYGLLTDESDRDIFILTPDADTDTQILRYDPEIDTAFFVWPVKLARAYWGHPLLLGNLTGDCTGNKRLCAFLKKHRHEITYAAPAQTVFNGLDYISVGERYGHTSPIKAGLRTAMILSHMAAEAEDPFLLSGLEKAVLTRARIGGVPPEERVEIYRRTLSPENLDKLRRMPENTTVRDELFALLDEIVKEETP